MESILKKMNYKTGQTVLLVNVPSTCQQLIETWYKDIEILELQELNDFEAMPLIFSQYDFYLLFVYNEAQVQAITESLKEKLKPDTALWFAYPKKTSKTYKATINRDSGWQALGALNYEPVRQIAIDDDFSALRFKPVDKIKTLTRNAKMTLSQAAKERLEG